MAFTSKAGMRARVTLLDLSYLCHADTSAGNDKGPKVKVLGGREPCTVYLCKSPVWVGKPGAEGHSPCTHPPATTKPLQLCPFQSFLHPQRRFHLSSFNHSYKMGYFSKSKPERSQWCLMLKLRGHVTSWSPETTYRPSKDLMKTP